MESKKKKDIWYKKRGGDSNEPICRTETDLETLKKLWLPKGTSGGKEGWTEGLELGYEHCDIWNDWPYRGSAV